LKELYFQDKDHFLVSICSLGVLYVWNLDNKDRAVDHALKNNKYNAVAYDSHYDLVIGACADQRIRVYTEKG
jgi:WD40 repeat protein